MQPTTNKNIHIYLESNPNPNSLKFVINEVLVPDGKSYDFPDTASAQHAPLALELFTYPFVERVFYMSNFITVTKNETIDWMEIQDILKKHIYDFLESGRFIYEEPAEESMSGHEEDTEEIKKIKNILDEYIRPAVEMDGGAIIFKSFDEGVVKVQLQGSCSGCPSSTLTLKAGIENLFKRMMPDEVKSVEAIA